MFEQPVIIFVSYRKFQISFIFFTLSSIHVPPIESQVIRLVRVDNFLNVSVSSSLCVA